MADVTLKGRCKLGCIECFLSRRFLGRPAASSAGGKRSRGQQAKIQRTIRTASCVRSKPRAPAARLPQPTCPATTMTMLSEGPKTRIDVEVCAKQECGVQLAVIKEAAQAWLSSLSTVRYVEGPVKVRECCVQLDATALASSSSQEPPSEMSQLV